MGSHMGRGGRGPLARPKNTSRKGRSGFTLIELTVSMSILMIGIVSVVSATTRMHALRKHNRERIVANNGLRSVAERIHARSYELSRSDPDNWAADLIAVYGPDGTVGDEFMVQGINVAQGQNAIGTIQILTDETLDDANLPVALGLPRDLNGDGDDDDADVSANATLLPVLLHLEWTGQSGVQTIDTGFYLTKY
ncbi:MAG TPA: hypothetical protein ENJ09_08860 [Planctomycetes bacterium]|nr:hypothetical protein [Planctomycetota bacterium]